MNNNEEIVEEAELLENPEDKNEAFLNNINSTLFVKRDYDMKDFDYEWLDKIEETIPYIDNILRNPKRFIVNEEEVVKIEQARRVTVESVIHLTQHTNLIQKIEDNGDVKPSKILNINREESLDTYENRFIFTLINNLRTFFETRIGVTSGSSYCLDKNTIKYEANSRVGSDNVKVSLKIDDISRTVQEGSGCKNNMSYSDRLKKIKTQLDGFTCTELYTSLARLHVAPVRSPIKKTNVILKNPNFRQAEQLWNYIQTFVSKDKSTVDKRDFYDKGALKNEYDQAFLMTFIANKNLIADISGDTETNVINQMMIRLIENLLDTDEDLTEDKIKELFNKQLTNIKNKNIQRAKSITKICDDRLDREINGINKVLEFIGNEAS